jgi:hypothetical protein
MCELIALTQLAQQINAEHAAAETALRAGLEHARAAGNLLAQAKTQVGHGQWVPWLKANVRFSVRTAQAYMRVAERWHELESKAQPVALLTFKDALTALAEPELNGEAALPLLREAMDTPRAGHGEAGDPLTQIAARAAAMQERVDAYRDQEQAKHIYDLWKKEVQDRLDPHQAQYDQAMAKLFVESEWPAQRIADHMSKEKKQAIPVDAVERVMLFGRFLSSFSTSGGKESFTIPATLTMGAFNVLWEGTDAKSSDAVRFKDVAFHWQLAGFSA